jgi:type IV pilus modification protein PilV
MKQNKGLTLIEVMIAIMVIAVGVIAAAGLQATALKNTAKAQAINEVTKIAENELAYQRSFDPDDLNCQTSIPSGYSCTTSLTGCAMQAGALTCNEAIAAPIAFQVGVTVSDTRGNNISLSTIIARYSGHSDE